MSTSLAMGIVAIVNLAIGYALALMAESHQRGPTAVSPIPSDSPSPGSSPSPQKTAAVAGSSIVNDPAPVAAVVVPAAPIAMEPVALAVDAEVCAEQLLESTTALAKELQQSAKPETGSVEPRAMLGDAAQLEAAIQDWWQNDSERTRPICIGQIEIDDMRQLTSKLDAASLGNLTRQIERLVLTTLREIDQVAALGRTRFLAVMPDLRGSEAAQLLEALRAQVESIELAPEVGPLRATISAAATQARSDDDVESLLARSAAALREASNAGRNRVACDDGNAVAVFASG